MKTYIENYIREFNNHFNNPNRNDTTWERVQYAGWLLDKYYPEFTADATYHKALYAKCVKALSNI